MRVVQVNYRFDEDLSDPEALLNRYVTLTGWSRALRDAGAHVSVVQRFRHDAIVTRDGVEYVFRGDQPAAAPSLAPPVRLHRAVANARPDIAHVNGLDAPVWTAALGPFLASTARLVVQDHASRVPQERGRSAIERRLRRLARGATLRAADAFFFTSADQADPWRQAGLIDSRQAVYEVLEASTDVRLVERSTARAATGVDGWPAVLWVGRLNANKDPLTVLDGFERSLQALPEATLTIVYGADDLLHDVRARVQASPALSARVRLVGAVPHDAIPAYCSAADVFALGSRQEGSGYALLEACACGAAPVVTNIPSFRAITGHGAVGALWTPGDPAAFARALQEIASRDRATLRAQVLEHFDVALSWPAVGRQAMAAYRDLAGRAR